MSDTNPDPEHEAEVREAAAKDAQARRRAAVFGDVLPETTGDERASDGAAEADSSGDEWLRANVPPHHG